MPLEHVHISLASAKMISLRIYGKLRARGAYLAAFSIYTFFLHLSLYLSVGRSLTFSSKSTQQPTRFATVPKHRSMRMKTIIHLKDNTIPRIDTHLYG